MRRRVIDKIEWLALNFDAFVPLALEGEFRDFYKLRAGDWRVVYRIDHKKRRIIVNYIDRRDKVYKKR